MIISELIEELEKLKKKHGDIPVEVYASTDCGYSGGGGGIEDITYHKCTDNFDKEFHKCDAFVCLNNYEG